MTPFEWTRRWVVDGERSDPVAGRSRVPVAVGLVVIDGDVLPAVQTGDDEPVVLRGVQLAQHLGHLQEAISAAYAGRDPTG